jgi:hypothetical protein
MFTSMVARSPHVLNINAEPQNGMQISHLKNAEGGESEVGSCGMYVHHVEIQDPIDMPA